MKTLQEKIRAFPSRPGVYWMKDAKGGVLYVGKAKNLRDRLRSYFRKEEKSRHQVDFLMRRTAAVDYRVCNTEPEALLLENNLIKKYQPRYNIHLKDDKSYASLKLNIRHPFPGLFVTRNIVKDGSVYFGPYVAAGPLRQTLDLLTKHFQLRTCSDHEFANRSRPCLEYAIGRCGAPCVGKISQEAYARQIAQARLFLEGREKELIHLLKERMRKASGQEAYEEAARLRNLIFAIKETTESQKAAVFAKKIEDPLEDKLLSNLQERLQLALKPAVIECVDISNFQGKEAVGALVCFAQGRPWKNRYRRFKIRMEERPNDYAMMRHVLARRFQRALNAPTPEEKQKWELPDLLLVDGGKGQLAIAQRILADLGLHSLAAAAIAKANKGEASDKIYIPNRKNPVGLRPGSKELLYLMRSRDEAHRFALAYHRQLRGKKALSKF
ncbi:MAG: excinuclease ABC subunit UvrC [Deltaproteobacteria bacterium]|nr:excinuclease ABC subunit UvrC [Deltaproteobacteria bacterium]